MKGVFLSLLQNLFIAKSVESYFQLSLNTVQGVEQNKIKQSVGLVLSTACILVLVIVLVLVMIKPEKNTEETSRLVKYETNESLMNELAEAINVTVSDGGEIPEDMSSLAQQLVEIHEASFGKDNCKVICDGKQITISVWKEGVSSGAVLALTNSEVKATWDYMGSNIQQLNQASYELATLEGYTEAAIITDVVSETDKELVLLSYRNGEVVFDIVNDYLN